ncbi:hypothetical protein M23134_03594 [Microscilla marina ATCC 23134]|uniref:Uncharacterized protein n=1 Tax=Microscilla marina ATCC 23134 TaxID=313606 RepID=A1ZRN8_MICM2|nr:hypothetical protein M23134_03594 [Microscilla marina ATCC 23134]
MYTYLQLGSYFPVGWFSLKKPSATVEVYLSIALPSQAQEKKAKNSSVVLCHIIWVSKIDVLI